MPKTGPHPYCCGLRPINLEHRVSFRLLTFSKVLLFVMLCELITDWMLTFHFLDPWALATGAKSGENPTLQMQVGFGPKNFKIQSLPCMPMVLQP